MDQNVCADCFEDMGLRAFVETEADSCLCSFCGKEGGEPIAASIESVARYIEGCLEQEYTDPANCLPYDSRQGGYQGSEIWSTAELLAEVVQLVSPNDEGNLLEAIGESTQTEFWCPRYPFSLDDDQTAEWTWRLFRHSVQHARRFFFTDQPATEAEEDLEDPLDERDPSPAEILRQTLRYAGNVGLLTPVAKGSRFFRARRQDQGVSHREPLELGPPPEERATQVNRMSPAGIVMFYASDSEETALRETADRPGTYAVGCFEILRDVPILDLVDIPDIPSLFEEVPDTLEYNPRPVLKFLHHVSRQISRPVPRDDRMDINYVPTQVFTEFVRLYARVDGMPVEGIRYLSSVHPGHASCVLFATQKHIVSPKSDKPWLRLCGRSEYTVSDEDLDRWEKDGGARS